MREIVLQKNDIPGARVAPGHRVPEGPSPGDRFPGPRCLPGRRDRKDHHVHPLIPATHRSASPPCPHAAARPGAGPAAHAAQTPAPTPPGAPIAAAVRPHRVDQRRGTGAAAPALRRLGRPGGVGGAAQPGGPARRGHRGPARRSPGPRCSRASRRMKEALAGAAGGNARRELFIYYSGHSNEEGLLLGREQVQYEELRRWINEADADVRIAILDSCASGALIRKRGGTPAGLVPAGRLGRGAGARLPDRQRGRRGGPGVRPHRGRVLHPLPAVGPARRRRHQPGRPGHPRRGLPVRLPGDAASHRAHGERAPARQLRHPDGRHRRPAGDDRPAGHRRRAADRRDGGRAHLRARRQRPAAGGAAQGAALSGRAGPGAGQLPGVPRRRRPPLRGER